MKYGFIIPVAALLLAAGTTGCSVFKPSGSGDSGKEDQGWYESGKGKADNDKKVSKTEAEKAMAKVDEKLKEIADVQATGALSGDWAIESVMGKKAVGETAPFIKLVPGEKRMYGNNGCNVMNASYETSYVDKTISFGNVATTMMMCAQSNITDVEIGQALELTKRYTVDTSGNDHLLSFYDAAGNKVMELMHRDFHFLDGTWAVTSIDGEKVSIEGMKLALDVDEKRMHGNTGCNIINGELETDMDAANSISFSGIAMTRMACPDSGWETRMMVALEEAVTARQINKDEIEFIGSNGKQVMTLKRSTPIED